MDLPRYQLFCATWSTFAPDSGLRDLDQTAGNAVALATALGELDACADEPMLLHNSTAGQCGTELDHFLRRPGDDVILYLSSHGLVPTSAQRTFRLATSDTQHEADANRAFAIADVIERLRSRAPGRKLLILDVSYTGTAAAALLSGGHVDLDLPSDICVLFADDPFGASDVRPNDALSAFTGALAEMLLCGIPGRGPLLTIRSLYADLHARAQSAETPVPRLVSTSEVAETIAFRNAAVVPPAPDVGPPLAERVADFEHRTEILYVEDDAEIGEQFQTALERAGHRVTLAGDPISGRAALSSGHFDIVVLDLLLVGDVPAVEFIRTCSKEAPQGSMLFLVSRKTAGSKDLWERLETIIAYPNRIAAFLWKPSYARTIEQHANQIRRRRRNTLSHVEGLDEAVVLVTEHLIARDEDLSAHSERLRLEIRATVERLVERWFPADEQQHVYIDSMEMRPIGSGRSSSTVFTLVPRLRGVDAESITPLVAKLGPADEIEEEVSRYDQYVQVGVPLDFRTDKIASAIAGGVGGIIYSFRGADDNSIQEVAELPADDIAQCLSLLFGEDSPKRWSASSGTGNGIAPHEHFDRLGFTEERFRGAFSALESSLARTKAALEPAAAATIEHLEDLYERLVAPHDSTLVHGDMSLENIVRINERRFAIIDYRTVGLGPRLIDFATLEITSWLLARGPGLTRSARLLDGVTAVPRSLDVKDGAEGVADWLTHSRRLARLCRQVARHNHPGATDKEYGALLYLAAVRTSEFRSRPATTEERNTQRALLPAIVLAAQRMINRRAA